MRNYFVVSQCVLRNNNWNYLRGLRGGVFVWLIAELLFSFSRADRTSWTCLGTKVQLEGIPGVPWLPSERGKNTTAALLFPLIHTCGKPSFSSCWRGTPLLRNWRTVAWFVLRRRSAEAVLTCTSGGTVMPLTADCSVLVLMPCCTHTHIFFFYVKLV